MTETQAQYLLILVGIIAFGFLLQGIAILVLALVGSKLVKQLSEVVGEAKGKVYPILANVHKISDKVTDISQVARDVAIDTAPKIQRVTSNITETSDVYRAKLAEVDSLMTDTAGKARRQSDRVDGMVTDVLDKTTEVTHTVTHAIMVPVRQMASLVSGAKVGIETLISNFTPKPQVKTPKPVAFEGESIYTGLEDDYHA
jgi:methyl-accepting chemotaxis protein